MLLRPLHNRVRTGTWSRIPSVITNCTCCVHPTRHSSTTTASTSTSTSSTTRPTSATAPSPSPSPNRLARDIGRAFLSFNQWLKINGAEFQQISLGGIRDGNWRVIAATDIHPQDIIIKIPIKLTMPIEASHLPHLSSILKHIPNEYGQLQLGVRLLSERCRSIAPTPTSPPSFWSSYISLLPAIYPQHPHFFPADVIQELQYQPIISHINRLAKMVQDITYKINTEYKSLFAGQEITPSLLTWAMCSVSSRSFQHHHMHRMFPLIDMCNHQFICNAEVVTRIDGDDVVACVRAKEEIKQGDEIFINYGNLDNDDYFVNYGVVHDDNLYDILQLKYQRQTLELAAEMVHVKLPKWEKWKDVLVFNVTHFQLGREMDPLLYAVVHLMLMEEQAIFHPDFATITSPGWTRPSSHHLTIHRIIHAWLDLLLPTSFPTSITQDLQLLAASVEQEQNQDVLDLHTFTPLQMALRYRISKKRILVEHIHRLKTLITKTST